MNTGQTAVSAICFLEGWLDEFGHDKIPRTSDWEIKARIVELGRRANAIAESGSGQTRVVPNLEDKT